MIFSSVGNTKVLPDFNYFSFVRIMYYATVVHMDIAGLQLIKYREAIVPVSHMFVSHFGMNSERFIMSLAYKFAFAI